MLSNISRDIVDKEHPSFDENRKHVFCIGFNSGFLYSEKNPDANSETIDAVSRDSMSRSNPWYEEYEKETYLLGFNRGYSYVVNDEARHYKQYMENPFSDQIGLGEATPDYDSADAAGLGVQFPILLKGTIIGWLPVDAIYDKDKPNHLISDDSHYLRMSSVGDSAEIKKEYRGQGYGKAAYYELAVKAARMGMTLCSAPDSSRSENANSLWKSLVSSGYARQNGDRYEFVNSKLIVTNKAVGGGIQTASKDMADIKNERIEFCKQIYEKYNNALGDIDDMFDRYDFINATPDLWIDGMYQHMNESERKRFFNLVDKDASINPISKNAILSRKELFFSNSPEKVIDINQEQELQARFDAFKAKHGEEPLYAEVTIRWKDDGTEQEDIIKLSDDIDERDDDKVFFNVTGLNDLKELVNPNNGEDFYIVDVQGITFQPKSLYLNDEKAMTLEQVQEKAVKLFGDNFEFDYWNETEAGTKIDRIDLGEMPDTIFIDKLEIKDGQLSLYSNDIGGDVDLKALDDIELSKVDVSLDEIKGYLDTQVQELADAKAKLFSTILEAKKDLGDHFSIVPTEISENGDKNVITEILPDFESPFEDQNIIGGVSHSGDEDCVHNLALCLENVNDAEALGKAVHEAHVKHLERWSKLAIHDRITNSWQRSFTSDQVDILNRYHQAAASDTPANEVFKELMSKVVREYADVARKPEKWVADTAKELDDLAKGITRGQDMGVHM